MKYNGCGRKWSWPNQRYSLKIHLEGWKKNHVKPVRTVGRQTKVGTEPSRIRTISAKIFTAKVQNSTLQWKSVQHASSIKAFYIVYLQLADEEFMQTKSAVIAYYSLANIYGLTTLSVSETIQRRMVR